MFFVRESTAALCFSQFLKLGAILYADSSTYNRIHLCSSLNAETGIVKFNEVYLGEAGVEGCELQDGGGSPYSGTGAGGGPLSLEQYICNAREALGVDSHYSRLFFFFL